MFDQVPRAKAVAIRSLLAAALVTLAYESIAQDIGEFEPRGLRLGTFNIFPSATVAFTYDDNVLAVPEDSFLFDESADGLFIFRPEILIEANTERHGFFIRADADLGRYFDLTDQDFNDLSVRIGGTWDITPTWSLSALGGYLNDSERASDPDRLPEQLFGTTEIDRYIANVNLSKRLPRGRLTLTSAYRRAEFDDVNADVFPTLANLATLTPTRSFNVNADRDLSIFRSNLRGTYRAGETYNLFANFRHRAVRYDKNAEGIVRWGDSTLQADCAVILPAGGPEEIDGAIPGRPTTREDCVRVRSTSDGRNRDFDVFSARVGTDVDFDELVNGNLAVGLTYATFAEPTGDEQNIGFSFVGDVDWILSRRTILNLSGAQGFRPTAGGAAFTTDLGSELTFALTRQATLGASALFDRQDRATGRVDNNILASAFASYAFNRHVSVAASYDYRRRTSSEAGRDFTRNSVFLSLRGQY